MTSPGDNSENKEVETGPKTPPSTPTVETSDYVVVQDDEGGEPMELPVTKEDNSLGMSTLTSAFPGSHGLKFKNPKTGASRALMLDASGTKFLSPPDGWEGKTFTVIFPPSRGAGEAKRRKFGDGSDSEDDEGAAKQKRLEDKPTDLICLGVSYTTSSETFKKHFEEFGEVVSADLKLNFEGKSKGFGFVLMSTLEEQDKVLKHERHEIDGRRVEVKIPDARSENFRNPLLPREQSTNKVFVGRLPETTTDELRAFFDSEAKKLNPHANITDCFLPRPFRGFGFVTFSTCEMARKICLANNFSMKGSPLAVSLAVPRDDPPGPPMRGGGRAGGLPASPYGGSGGYGYGYGGGARSEYGYDDWSGGRGGGERYGGSSWEKSPPARQYGGGGGGISAGLRAGPPPAHLQQAYNPPAYANDRGGGPSTPAGSGGYNGGGYGSGGGSSGGYSGGDTSGMYGGSGRGYSYGGSGGYGGSYKASFSAPSTSGGGQQYANSLSMALAGNIPNSLGGGGGRVGPGGGTAMTPQQQQQQAPVPASLATGLDALTLNRNGNPEVFSAAWAAFMNTLKNGGHTQGPPPNQPPPQHHHKW